MEDALLRDDPADQEGDEEDDGHGPPGDAVELIDGRGEPEILRSREHADRRRSDRAKHFGESEQVLA